MTPAKFILVNLLATVTLSLPKCFEITEVRQPETVQVEQEFTIEVDVELTGKDGEILVFAMLAPAAWRWASNTEVSFTSSIGGSTMSLMPDGEVDAENKLPWPAQIADREGIGQNYGEVEWVVYKADNAITPPSNTSADNPANGTITVRTKAGTTNMISQMGFFVGEAVWGYLNDGNNSIAFFQDPCIEVQGGSGQPQNLCEPAPTRIVDLTTFTFDDILTIVFDAKEDTTDLIGASKIFFCSRAVYDGGVSEVCDMTVKSEMRSLGNDKWQLAIWPPDYYDVVNGEAISEILCSFQDDTGIVVKDPSGNDFQILAKCFQ